MVKHLVRFTVLICAMATVLVSLPASASAAPSPWWQVLTGSRPTNLWEPQNQVQELDKSEGVTILQYEGTPVVCMGSPSCPLFGGLGLENSETAVQLQGALEALYGAGNVAVTEDPDKSSRLLIEAIGEDAGKPVVPLEVLIGTSRVNVVQQGGSGRLVLTLTNLGDAPVDGSSTPVTIVDEMPEGVIAHDATALAGRNGIQGPVDCTVESNSEVRCGFEGELPPYEAIEVEILVGLVDSPPQAGAPGKVRVSGGGAQAVSSAQPIKVSAEAVDFGIEQFSVAAEDEGGSAALQAGGHPFQLTTTLQLNSGAMVSRYSGVKQPAQPRNLRFPFPPGLVGNVATLPRCPMAVFLTPIGFFNKCPDRAALGAASVTIVESGVLGMVREAVPVFNLAAGPGEPARFGFMVLGDPVVIDFSVDPDQGYRLIAKVSNITQLPQFLASTLTIWGTPGDPRHDGSRGWGCVNAAVPLPCEPAVDLQGTAQLRQSVSCKAAQIFGLEAEPWNMSVGTQTDSASFAGEPLLGCNRAPFNPGIAATPTSKLASNPSGFDFEVDMPNSGLDNPEGIAEAQPKKVEVTLPEGMTVNPSEGEGLVGCSPADLARETSDSQSGAGCPNTSRIGDVKVTTPLLKEEATGALYIATPHDNPFDSLLGLYLVARIPERGIIIKLAGKVEPDPNTGQLTTTFDDLPQLPFSSFKLHFREGGRAPLATPPTCGTYTAEARFVPWSAQDPDNPAPNEVVRRNASFTIERGVDGGACPPKATPPFHPDLLAGTVNNAAGSFSDFNLRLTRNDGEQEFTHFSIKLPPGITGKLAGVPYCPESGIAQARSRTGIHGGQEELDSPSCPPASQIGRTLVGAGVGSILTYVPGKIYLAGPYNGAPLSMVAITSGVVGPFDIGTVVIRQAFRIDPETGEVFVDATSSDPIPHIIQGIPVHARDIRAYVDRPNFTLNPTNCKRTSTASTVLGSGLDFASPADDNPITVTSPFQAADCAALPFKPKLALKLKGGTRRGSHPAFTATLKGQGIGAAGIARAQVTLPRSEFIENAHFKTICTRVQFKAGNRPGEGCPAGSIYGKAKATTPILSEPLSGPVFLRSSEHQLPDLVIALHSPTGIDITLVGRVDSVDGQLRSTFESVPDAPVSSFTLQMQGGKKGLFVNSTNLCKTTHKAVSEFDGQNGKQLDSKPVVKATACKGKAAKHKRAR
jgi:hypothetical protein